MQSFKQWPIYLIGRILPAAIGFGAIAIYTRLLDPASFGTYALLLSTASLIGTTGYSWLKVASLRLTATVQPEGEPAMILTIGMIFAALSVPVFLIVVGVVLICAHVGWFAAALAGVCAIASGWFELNISMVQARLKVKTYGLLQLGRVIAALCASLILIRAGFKANALLAGFAIGNCVGLGSLVLWRQARRGRFDGVLLKQFVKIGWPSSAQALGSVSNTFQRYMLQAVGGSAAVGIYAAASDFSQQTVGLLIGTATLAGQPLAFRARDLGSAKQLTDQLRNNAQLVFGIALPAAAGLIALAGPISQVYLGARFHANAPLLIAIWAMIVFLSGLRGSYFEQVFEIAQKTRAMAINTVLRFVVIIALSFWLIGRYGSIGAAVTMLVSEVAGLLLSVVLAGRLMPVPIPWLSWAKTACATGVMVVVVTAVPARSTVLGLAEAVVAGITVYAVAMLVAYVRRVRVYLDSIARIAQRPTRQS